MKTILKYIRIILLSLVCVAGCESIQTEPVHEDQSAEVVKKEDKTLSAFNDKQYIWTFWQTTTNRTSEVIK